ncbi:MAG: SufE family protein [Prevotella sp.]|nr:SufE family protein [Prevotella sp.]MCM1074837.1 SufE family protein [Ruminococcus sp.]
MSINEVQDEIIEEFEGLTDWMDRYAYIIELGSQMPSMEEKYKTPANLIEGCQSRVWIEAQLDESGHINFEADSDAMIVKGIVALLMRVLNHRTPKEILDCDLYFIEKIGLKENLSPTRSNGLVAMLKQIRLYAVAFDALEKK